MIMNANLQDASRNRWAFVVGANDYEFFPQLDYAALDATAFVDTLEADLDFDENRILLLTDSKERPTEFKPTQGHLFHALGLLSDLNFHQGRHVAPVGPDDLFVFYFSGHGIRTEEGEEFLLPVGASDKDVSHTSIPLNEIVKRIEALPCRHQVFFIDACRADPQEAGAKGPGGPPGLGTKGRFVDRDGTALFFSCDPAQRSYEVEALQHGTFTYELLQAVMREDVNTLGELDDHLKSRVPRLNQQHDKPLQLPFCELRPTDMGDVALWRRGGEVDQLIAMANDLFAQKRIDWDWYLKLEGVWTGEHVLNRLLKKELLRRFHAGEMAFDAFESRWLRSDKHFATLRSEQPEVEPSENRTDGE